MRGLITSERRQPQKAKILTQKAFKYAINSYEVVCIFFYAEWCPGYNPITEYGNHGFEYDKAADIIAQLYPKSKGKKGKAIMLKMNCNNDKLLANKFNIWGYPTYKIVKNGEFIENLTFNYWERTTENFLQFVEQAIDNRISRNSDKQLELEAVILPKTDLLTTDSYRTVLGGYNFALVMFYTDWCTKSKEALPIFEEASVELRKSGNWGASLGIFRLNCNCSSKFAKSLNIRSYPTVRMFKDGADFMEYRWDGSKGFVEFVKNYARREEKT